MRVYPTLIGQRFGKLIVVEQLSSTTDGQRRWICQCDCGNTFITTTYNLNCGRSTNCGCKKSPDLTGKVFGRLTVIGRSDKRSSRGNRTAPLWECRCECGAITYRATDTLTNEEESMCAECAAKNRIEAARKEAGFVDGTQVTKIREMNLTAANTSGCRGVYFDKTRNCYRARLKFKGKIMSFGSYHNFNEAVAARKAAEEKYFGAFLNALGETKEE